MIMDDPERRNGESLDSYLERLIECERLSAVAGEIAAKKAIQSKQKAIKTAIKIIKASPPYSAKRRFKAQRNLVNNGLTLDNAYLFACF